jgi:peptidoglycan/LPS O-acetylase OafA/YrhL
MKPAHQIDALTILRGRAALAMLFQHCYITSRTSYFGETAIVPPSFRWSDYGTFGVTLFFALSGFTLYIYGASVLTDMRKFFVGRVCRIYPAFVVSPIAYLVVGAASN